MPANRHRDLALMMKAAAAPSVPWVHLWRLVDGAGSTAPDSVGTVDFTLQGGASFDADGVLFAGGNDVMIADSSLMDVNFGVGGTDDWTIVVSMVPTDYGEAGYGRIIINQRDGTLDKRRLEVYYNTAESGISYRISLDGNAANSHAIPITFGSPHEISIVRDYSGTDRIVTSRGGVIDDTISGDYVTTFNDSSLMQIGNAQSLDRGINGICRWVGITNTALTNQEIEAIIQAGRPPAP